MKALSRTQITSFLSAAGALGVASVLTRACPGGCASCASCATALVPMRVSATAIGAALVSSAAARKRRDARSASANGNESEGP